MKKSLHIAFFVLLAMIAGTLGLAQANKPAPGRPIPVVTNTERPSPWAIEAVELAIRRGWFIGFSDGTFRWKEEVSREQLALVLTRVVNSLSLDKLNARELATLAAGLAELRAQMLAQSGLKDQVKALEQALSRIDLPGNLTADLQTLFEALADQQVQTEALRTQLAARFDALESLDARISALEQSNKDLRAFAFPSRDPLYFSLGGFRSDSTGQAFARIGLGHDALWGDWGLRAQYELPLSTAVPAISADLTYRRALDTLDATFGVGMGLQLNPQNSLFAQVQVGLTYHLTPGFGLSFEGNQRYLLDGSDGQRSDAIIGIKLRF